MISDEVETSGSFRRKKLFEVMIRWLAPVCLVVIWAGEILKIGLPEPVKGYDIDVPLVK